MLALDAPYFVIGAALHAEVVPSTHGYTGTSRTTISGIDMLLQVRLHGLRARIRTDVAAVRAMQQQESAAVRARIAALRSTLAQVVAPLVRRYQADVTRLQEQLTRDLAAANVSLHRSRLILTRLMSLQQLQGWIDAGSRVALRRGPTSQSAVAGWLAPMARLRLVGYIWGWTVHNPRTGVTDGRWYIVPPLRYQHGYLYVPAALVRLASPR